MLATHQFHLDDGASTGSLDTPFMEGRGGVYNAGRVDNHAEKI